MYPLVKESGPNHDDVMLRVAHSRLPDGVGTYNSERQDGIAEMGPQSNARSKHFPLPQCVFSRKGLRAKQELPLRTIRGISYHI